MIHPVILSGGSGSRLWPLSREHHPKQLLALLGERTLLQDTALRLNGMADVASPIVVCNAQYRFLIAEQMRTIDKMPCTILLEPAGRNTAPALTMAALRVARDDPDGLLLAMPADHAMRDPASFRAAVQRAAVYAAHGRLVTFGIVPTHAETGYGYIRSGGNGEVVEFVEKPDQTRAAAFCASGDYLWNSGLFLVHVRLWLEELGRLRPDILAACEDAMAHAHSDGDFVRIGASFAETPSESIDYAVMEHTDRATVVPLDAGWSDIGAWPALWELGDRDGDGNVIRGEVFTVNARDNLLMAEHRLVGAVGVSDIVVIETKDAVLVADRRQAQDVKQLVAKLKGLGRSECATSSRVWRPWGCYETMDIGPRFQVKRIMVKPKAALSMQMHYHRAEHWIVVAGTARVTRGDEEFVLSENQSTYIPLGTRHRLENPGLVPLEMIEVQSGAYLGEDDITRFEDLYNRSGHE
ncbi:MAG: mannose-1-phosphate guanylyltransferase/mannose-6-phosphate isomerase [Gammaproteobacteria bacterium]|nr:mannose-1-phosphate guanylyltransferase/mannose-6-phosphate isomerase [Gammaproteobacteria bacterium]